MRRTKAERDAAFRQLQEFERLQAWRSRENGLCVEVKAFRADLEDAEEEITNLKLRRVVGDGYKGGND